MMSSEEQCTHYCFCDDIELPEGCTAWLDGNECVTNPLERLGFLQSELEKRKAVVEAAERERLAYAAWIGEGMLRALAEFKGEPAPPLSKDTAVAFIAAQDGLAAALAALAPEEQP